MSSAIVNQLIFFSFSISLFLFLLCIINKPKGAKYMALAGYFLASAAVFYSSYMSAHVQSALIDFLMLYAYQLTVPFLFLYAQVLMKGKRVPRLVFLCFFPICISIPAFLLNSEVLFILSIILEELMLPVFCVISLYQLYRYRLNLKKRYSNLQKNELSWVRILFIADLVFWGLYSVFEIVSEDPYSIENHRLSVSISAVFVLYLGIWGIRYTDSFQFQNPGPGDDSRGKLAASDAAELKVQLENEMKAGLYLEPELTLFDVSKKLGVSESYVSEVINMHMKSTFYDFVNGYRVEQVCDSLKSRAIQDKTILAIALESGFNSKATFNRIFKKHTGCTPSQFVKALT